MRDEALRFRECDTARECKAYFLPVATVEATREAEYLNDHQSGNKLVAGKNKDGAMDSSLSVVSRSEFRGTLARGEGSRKFRYTAFGVTSMEF